VPSAVPKSRFRFVAGAERQLARQVVVSCHPAAGSSSLSLSSSSSRTEVTEYVVAAWQRSSVPCSVEPVRAYWLLLPSTEIGSSSSCVPKCVASLAVSLLLKGGAVAGRRRLVAIRWLLGACARRQRQSAAQHSTPRLVGWGWSSCTRHDRRKASSAAAAALVRAPLRVPSRSLGDPPFGPVSSHYQAC
jgi:hypothetical protein